MKKFFVLSMICSLPLWGLEEEDSGDLRRSVQEYNSYLQQALQEKYWWAVIDWADLISRNFPTSPFAEDTSFLMGKAYANLGQWELANECFTAYLNHAASPKHFEETIQYKFNIAEQFRNGAKKPLFGSHKLPKLIPAKEDALTIYDEVITALPHSEFAAQSLLGKAKIQVELEDYKPSLETLDLLIRRFPKHDLAAEGYLEKVRTYLVQCQGQNLDPDLLDLAAVTLRKFRSAFPREPRIQLAEEALFEMEEIFATHLLDTGRFFEKTKKIPASIIYYNRVVTKYPNTEAAKIAGDKLERLQVPKESS